MTLATTSSRAVSLEVDGIQYPPAKRARLASVFSSLSSPVGSAQPLFSELEHVPCRAVEGEGQVALARPGLASPGSGPASSTVPARSSLPSCSVGLTPPCSPVSRVQASTRQHAGPRATRRRIIAPSSDSEVEIVHNTVSGPPVAEAGREAELHSDVVESWHNSTPAAHNPNQGSSDCGLAQLTAMGFPSDLAASTLAAAAGNVIAAAEALTDSTEKDEMPGKVGMGVDVGAPNPESEHDTPHAQLMSMGFSEEAVTAALAAVDGDIRAAAEVLMETTEADVEKAKPPLRQCAGKAASVHRERSSLEALSKKATIAVVNALAGPGCARTSMVSRSIHRGRVRMHRNLWEGDDGDSRLAGLSAAYGRLKGYQKAGVRWLLALAEVGLGGILADEMGLGKTAQVLTFLDLLPRYRSTDGDTMSRLPAWPSLAVVPTSLLGTWMDEMQKWCPHFRAFRYHASTASERTAMAEDYFSNYDGRCWLVVTTPSVLHNKEDRAIFFRRIHFGLLICDEAHSLKNAATARYRDAQRGLRADRRFLLTGTPVQNSLHELANLLMFIMTKPGERGANRPAAVHELEELVERGSLRTLQVRAAPLILRRLKRDVMSDLPPKEGKTVRCTLEPTQRALYDREVAEAQAVISTGTHGVRARREFVKGLCHRLRRLCNHPLLGQSKLQEADYARLGELLREVRPDYRRVSPERLQAELLSWSDFDVANCVRDYKLAPKLGPGFARERFEMSRTELLEGSAKIAELLRLLQEQREAKRKTLVFSQFTQFLALISRALHCSGFKYVRLDGGTSVAERAKALANFQNESSIVDAFLLSTKAGGLGLNLTEADRVVMMDLSFNPQDNRQAEDRAHRLGQTRQVSVHYLVCADTIEESIVRINMQKMALDYKFGGQKMLLHGCCPEAPFAEAACSPGGRAEKKGDAWGGAKQRDNEKDVEKGSVEENGVGSEKEDEEGDESEEDKVVDGEQLSKKVEHDMLAELEHMCAQPPQA